MNYQKVALGHCMELARSQEKEKMTAACYVQCARNRKDHINRRLTRLDASARMATGNFDILRT